MLGETIGRRPVVLVGESEEEVEWQDHVSVDFAPELKPLIMHWQCNSGGEMFSKAMRVGKSLVDWYSGREILAQMDFGKVVSWAQLPDEETPQCK